MHDPATTAQQHAASLARHIVEEPCLAFLPGVMAELPSSEWYLVGGSVRDHVLGRTAKDHDLVVRGAPLDALRSALERRGRVDLVGRDFGVLRFVPEGCEAGEPVDIALPRSESSRGSGGYRDFDVQADPALPLERDLARRDFTMNAIAFNVRTLAFVDPFGGVADIAAASIRTVGAPHDRFAEDLSRVLRGVRLAAELGFSIHGETWEAITALAPRMDDQLPDGGFVVPRETVARNLVRALAADPVRAVELLESSGLLFRLAPELARLPQTAQSPDHHSEGDVWTHTKLALAALRSAAFAERFPGEAADAETVFAVLLHDIGKPQTAQRDGERITFHGHDRIGAEMTRVIARRLRLSSVPEHPISEDRLAELVHMHLFPNAVDLDAVRKSTLVRHFLRDRAHGRRLLHLAFADASAAKRPDGTSDLSTLARLVGALAELEAQGTVEDGKVKTVLSGDDIMDALHLSPGPEVGRLLAALQEAQLNGEVATTKDAQEFLRGLLAP